MRGLLGIIKVTRSLGKSVAEQYRHRNQRVIGACREKHCLLFRDMFIMLVFIWSGAAFSQQNTANVQPQYTIECHR